jgi:glycosyltransferase involved in cell wall biosynthesis
MKDPSIWVVLAAYNEAATLPPVADRLRSLGYRVVCVDDGSTDDTALVARRSGCELVVHPFNLGQGAAIQTGLEYALERGADYVCTVDADGQHNPDEIPRLLEALDRRGADFALGSRFLGDTIDMPRARRILLSAAIMFTRLTTGLRVTDTHNGMRAMTRRGAASIHLRQDRMAHASEILAQIERSGLPMIEVPVTISYTAYSLAKGQRTSSALRVLGDLAAGMLHR